MPGVYRVEVSSNNRAGCRNKECKDAGVKIFKGQLRFGTYVTIQEHQSWHWKHWGCVTPKQVINLNESIDGQASELDGYEDLPEDLQAKIDKAIEEGHVADDDWTGDVEMNREGKNGYRTPESKKAKKAEAQALNEGSDSPVKSPSKKRGRTKEESGDQAMNGEAPKPKRQKKKAANNKDKAVKEEHEHEAEPANQSRKTKVKKEVKIKDEEGESASGSDDVLKGLDRKKANNGKAGKGRQAAVGKGASMSNSTTQTAATRSRPPRKAALAKKIKDEDSQSEESENATPQPTKATLAKKNKGADIEPDVARDEGKKEISRNQKTSKGARKATTSKKVKDEEIETDMLQTIPDPIDAHSGSRLDTEGGSENEDEAIVMASKPHNKGGNLDEKSSHGTRVPAAGKSKAVPQDQRTSPSASRKSKRSNGRASRSQNI